MPIHEGGWTAIILLAVLALLIAVGLGLRYAYRLLAIGVSYKAKVLCSGVFISRRSPQSVLSEDLAAEDLAPLRFIDTQVDLAGQQVLASFLGVIRQKAVYRAGSGCTLVVSGKGMAASAQAGTLQQYTVISAGMTRIRAWPKIDGNPSLAKGVVSGLSAQRQQVSNPRLDAALDWAFAEPDPKRKRRTRAVLVMQDGKIVAEGYAPGFGPDMPLAGWSLAKGVMNALVGILVGEGRLDLAASAPVPEWQGADDPRREITLDQLMRMVSGLEFSEKAGEPLGDVTRMLMREADAAAYAANKPLEAKPGTRWAYASGTTNIISRLIRDKLGDADYHSFPTRALFGPLGMSSAVLETDPSGTFVGSSYLYATARDWAKLGQLYLQDGAWEGRRLLPEGWVDYSTRPTADRRYGAHFWLDIQAEYESSDPEKPLPSDAFHAMGYEGQCVSIVPSSRLVVVRLGLTRNPSAWRQDRFVNQIVAALGG